MEPFFTKMPRTSAANRTVVCTETNTFSANGAEYLQPGTYIIPQLVHPASLYTADYSYTYPLHWSHSDPSTYSVDAIGGGYYRSDFEYILHFPQNYQPINETEITYHYYIKENESVEDNFNNGEDELDAEEALSVCKIEPIETEPEDALEDGGGSSCKAHSNESGKNVYRTKQGYLVEEPSDDEDLTMNAK